jgi:hypothetical protein
MTDTVEVVAARPLTLPAGQVEAKELFPATTGQASSLASMGMLVLADTKGEESALDRAVAAGTAARKELDARLKQEAKDAQVAEDEKTKAAAKKPAPKAEKEG